MSYTDALTSALETTVAPNARAVDEQGMFPQASIDALAQAGILGLVSEASLGGGGAGLRAAADVIEQLAGVCGSTAMVVLMHYAATAVLETHADESARKRLASGDTLTTLAFSEAGSRSHFWAPLGTAQPTTTGVRLDASKSWITAAGHADWYVWSSRPLAAEGPMTLWLVPADAPGLGAPGAFDGLGLRGNASAPVRAENVVVPADAMLGADGSGLDIALSTALPWFLVLSGAFALGIMEAVVRETVAHATATRLEHLGRTIAEDAVPRAEIARMRVETDVVRGLMRDTLDAIETGREDATLRALEIKAAAADAAISVTDRAMTVCGGAAFRKEVGIERRFRDARAARVMAPTTAALLDFIGRAITGLPLLDGPA